MSETFTEMPCPLCGEPKTGIARVCSACSDEFASVSGLSAVQVLRLRQTLRFSRWERIRNYLQGLWR